jgi:Asp-tRNA(Asn)/Glu-tRNA(Gln) amidotransferase A subunit family amidase
MVADEVLHLTIEELGDRIRARRLSPVELTESYLARLKSQIPNSKSQRLARSVRARGERD